MHAGLGGLHRIVLVVDRRGGAGEIEDLVDFDVERKRHVVTHQLEIVVVEQVIDIAPRAGEIIVDAQHAGAALEQAVAKVRAEKSGAPGHQHACFEMHTRNSQKLQGADGMLRETT